MELKLKILDLPDKNSLFELITKNQTYLAEWIEWAKEKQTIEKIEKFIIRTKALEREAKGTYFGIYLMETLVGVIGSDNYGNGGLKLSYWVSQEHQGKGICTNACKKLIDWMQEERNIKLFFIDINKNNSASRRVADKLKFTVNPKFPADGYIQYYRNYGDTENLLKPEDLYEIIETVLTIDCDVFSNRATFIEKTTILRKVDYNFYYENFFEYSAECLQFDIKINGQDEIGVGKKYWNEKQHIKKATILIKENTNKNSLIKIETSFSRSILLKRINGFLEARRFIVGFFWSMQTFCKNFSCEIRFNDNNNRKNITIRNEMSSAESCSVKEHGKVINFLRKNIPAHRLLPMTVVIDKGHMKLYNIIYSFIWVLIGALFSYLPFLVNRFIGGR